VVLNGSHIILAGDPGQLPVLITLAIALSEMRLSVLDDDDRALSGLQERAFHGLLDEHDQAFIASRVLSSLPDGELARLLPLRNITVHTRNVLVCAANTDRHGYAHLMAYLW
jgi:hypothetical protein